MYKSRKQLDVLTHGDWLEVSGVWGIGPGVCTAVGDNPGEQGKTSTPHAPHPLCFALSCRGSWNQWRISQQNVMSSVMFLKDHLNSSRGSWIRGSQAGGKWTIWEHELTLGKVEATPHLPLEAAPPLASQLAKRVMDRSRSQSGDGESARIQRLQKATTLPFHLHGEQVHLCAKQNRKGRVELLTPFALSVQT